ncbi:MAG: hypothetical protein J6I76_00500 [Oribacterium sp.]|nr:hypothetical protein [Oribacterium sp.]
MELYPHQVKAIEKLKNGSILCGDVGTGKSRTALAYFYKVVCNGDMEINGEGSWGVPTAPRDLFIITTAKKRDSLEWMKECIIFGLNDDPEKSVAGIKVTVDSWNNIKKYKKIYNSFFIFDEQRVSGKGAWVKAFLQIARKNQWILLTATPGDTWSDYMPVFIANGFYRNQTEFYKEHCVFSPYTNYPKIERYVNEGELARHAAQILVKMKFRKAAEQNHYYIQCNYNKRLYMTIFRDRWDPYDSCPIEETGKLCYLLRKVCNSDVSRIEAVSNIMKEKKKAIIFYNYTYEVEALRELFEALKIQCAEWNGQKHEEVPIGESWGYFVQYNAGAEGWNCITTDTLIFFSQHYSYRLTVQAAGRIDRMNTPYSELYYYHLKSVAPIDVAISRALKSKKNFNEKNFLGK